MHGLSRSARQPANDLHLGPSGRYLQLGESHADVPAAAKQHNGHHRFLPESRLVIKFFMFIQTRSFQPNFAKRSQAMATLEVGPKSSLVVYELMPTRRRKAIPVHITAQQHNDPVALAFSADAKLLATLLPEAPSCAATGAGNALVVTSTSQPPPTPNSSYSVTVYLWRTGKTLATMNLGTPSIPSVTPQVSAFRARYAVLSL